MSATTETNHRVTIAVLDDNPLVLRLTKGILRSDPVEVLTASSWLQLKNLLATRSPDIIFIDVNLPGIKGNQVSALLRSQEETMNTPLILISELPESQLAALLPSSGADAWLRKPLTREMLLETIRHFVPTLP